MVQGSDRGLDRSKAVRSASLILPNKIGAVTAPVIFGKMHFLLISENDFFYEIKCNGITSFMDFMIVYAKQD